MKFYPEVESWTLAWKIFKLLIVCLIFDFLQFDIWSFVSLIFDLLQTSRASRTWPLRSGPSSERRPFPTRWLWVIFDLWVFNGLIFDLWSLTCRTLKPVNMATSHARSSARRSKPTARTSTSTRRTPRQVFEFRALFHGKLKIWTFLHYVEKWRKLWREFKFQISERIVPSELGDRKGRQEAHLPRVPGQDRVKIKDHLDPLPPPILWLTTLVSLDFVFPYVHDYRLLFLSYRNQEPLMGMFGCLPPITTSALLAFPSISFIFSFCFFLINAYSMHNNHNHAIFCHCPWWALRYCTFLLDPNRFQCG